MGSEGLIDRYVCFYTDFAFKKLFGTEANKKLLISFLNSLLDREGKEAIEDVTYLNTEQLGAGMQERRAIFDIYCRTVAGESFLIEMQNADQSFFKDRLVFYSTFPIRDHAQRGKDWNYDLAPVYVVAFLNFSLEGQPAGRYRTDVHLRCDQGEHEVFYDKLQFITLEMPKFQKTLEEVSKGSLFDRWMYAIKHLGDLENKPKELREAVFEDFFRRAEIASYDREERVTYLDSLKSYRDNRVVVETALERGREEGKKEGREEGRKEGVCDVAMTMKRRGVDVETIHQFTGLTREEIEKM